MIKGTSVEAKVNRLVDGDTIRVFLPGANEDESLRILALDTEESYAGGGKPVTPWGKKAKERAESFFNENDTVKLEFPGFEPYEECIKKYRGNFGRLLVYVHKDGVDFQETMIKEGYSPYFTKYGNAQFESHHKRYIEAERTAQMNNIGVWNQLEVNGTEIRNYAALGTWWKLRAEVIDRYREVKKSNSDLLNTRLDYAEIKNRANSGEEAVIFTELRTIKRVGDRSAVIKIGSIEQPFSLFLPDIESTEGQTIIQLFETRYISGGETYPRRSYAYINGKLSLYNDKPQIVIKSVAQITDEVPS